MNAIEAMWEETKWVEGVGWVECEKDDLHDLDEIEIDVLLKRRREGTIEAQD